MHSGGCGPGQAFERGVVEGGVERSQGGVTPGEAGSKMAPPWLRWGIGGGDYGSSSALGFLLSVVSLALAMSALG